MRTTSIPLTAALILLVTGLAITLAVYDQFFGTRAQLLRPFRSHAAEQGRVIERLKTRHRLLETRDRLHQNTLARHTEALQTAQTAVQQAERHLEALAGEPLRAAEALHLIERHTRRHPAAPHPVPSLPPLLSAEPIRLDRAFPSHPLVRVRDVNDSTGLVLTGPALQTYARLIRHDQALASTLTRYREQARAYARLVTAYEATLRTKEDERALLTLRLEAEQHRAELYQALARAERGSLLQTTLRKLALPAGLVAGILAGRALAN